MTKYIYSTGSEIYSQVKNDEVPPTQVELINKMAELGWEPFMLSPSKNGVGGDTIYFKKKQEE